MLKIIKIEKNPRRKKTKKKRAVKCKHRGLTKTEKKSLRKKVRLLTKIEKKILARKNPPVKRRHETIIAGLVKVGKKYKRFYFTGKGFSRDRGDAKVYPGSLGKVEAQRILPMLPARIERLYVEKA